MKGVTAMVISVACAFFAAVDGFPLDDIRIYYYNQDGINDPMQIENAFDLPLMMLDLLQDPEVPNGNTKTAKAMIDSSDEVENEMCDIMSKIERISNDLAQVSRSVSSLKGRIRENKRNLYMVNQDKKKANTEVLEDKVIGELLSDVPFDNKIGKAAFEDIPRPENIEHTTSFKAFSLPIGQISTQEISSSPKLHEKNSDATAVTRKPNIFSTSPVTTDGDFEKVFLNEAPPVFDWFWKLFGKKK